MSISVSQVALAVGAFALVCSTAAARADDAPSTAALEAQIKLLQKQMQGIATELKAVKAKESKAKAAETTKPPVGGAPLQITVLPADAQLNDERSRAAPNFMVEPLWPSMDLINNPNTWLGIYGTIEADFTGWLRENIDKLPVARAQVEEILRRRQK